MAIPYPSMSILQKRGAMLADLVRERREATDEWWRMRLDEKIEDLKAILRTLGGS